MKNKSKKPHTIISFLKFGEEKHIKDLFYNGTIYMNSIQYFRKFEDGFLRGDKYEGLSSIKNYPPGQFEIPSINFKGDYISLHLRESYPIVLGNIYSLYCISSKGWDRPQDCKIDNKNKHFGNWCVLIKNVPEFFLRIESKLKELNLKYHHGFVDYYDKNKVNKKITLFEKSLEFEYQKEFRFYIDRESDEALSIPIGSIENIAEIYFTDEMVDTLKLNN